MDSITFLIFNIIQHISGLVITIQAKRLFSPKVWALKFSFCPSFPRASLPSELEESP